jgi:crossover junction endodeoxyribonuclease RusA
VSEHPKPVTLTLPYPPSANRLWRAVNGRNIKSREYRDWMTEAYAAVLQQYTRPHLPGDYRMTINADRPDRRRRDLGNILKAAEDALVHCGVVQDDSMAQGITLAWSGSEPVKPALLHISLEAA